MILVSMKVRKVFTIIREYFLKVVHRKKVATQYILCEPDFVKQKHRLKTSSFLKKKKSMLLKMTIITFVIRKGINTK